MAKNHSTGIVRVEESEIRKYLDVQVKEAVKQVLEEIMNTEAEELLCARPYERSVERRDYRNGSRGRKLKTRVGEIELSVPRLRTLSHCPSRRRGRNAILTWCATGGRTFLTSLSF